MQLSCSSDERCPITRLRQDVGATSLYVRNRHDVAKLHKGTVERHSDVGVVFPITTKQTQMEYNYQTYELN